MYAIDALPGAPARAADGNDWPPPGAFWVFAYGSLIWNPGFAYADRQPARLWGYHRRFCIRSTGYRGTPDTPGLVLGLDHGGSCLGMAFLVAASHAQATLDYLDGREMSVPVYRRRLLPVRFGNGGRVLAVTYVARRDWPAYCRLPRDRTAALIAHGHGTRGSNREYLLRTLEVLRAAGIVDSELELLAARLPRR